MESRDSHNIINQEPIQNSMRRFINDKSMNLVQCQTS